MICYNEQDPVPRNDCKFSISHPFLITVQHIKKNRYTVVTLYSLLGFWLNHRMYILGLGKQFVFSLFSLKLKKRRSVSKNSPLHLALG